MILIDRGARIKLRRPHERLSANGKSVRKSGTRRMMLHFARGSLRNNNSRGLTTPSAFGRVDSPATWSRSQDASSPRRAVRVEAQPMVVVSCLASFLLPMEGGQF